MAFLWQRNQSMLLREMIDRGVHAVLVKVATIGKQCALAGVPPVQPF